MAKRSISLPDDLCEKAESEAHALGESLSAFITNAIQSYLAGQQGSGGQTPTGQGSGSPPSGSSGSGSQDGGLTLLDVMSKLSDMSSTLDSTQSSLATLQNEMSTAQQTLDWIHDALEVPPPPGPPDTGPPGGGAGGGPWGLQKKGVRSSKRVGKSPPAPRKGRKRR